MAEGKSATSSMESTGDTSRLLKELMDLQKSNVSSIASIDRSVNLQDSHEQLQTISGMVQNSGDGTDPTLTELMKTMYDGATQRQLITLQGTDTANSFSVYGQEVDIVSSKQNKTQSLNGSTGSNKVKITPVVNYDWEHRRYVGNLVAVHRNNEIVAYVLKGKTSGVVRITNRKTAERDLLKDFTGRVIDLAFAYTDDILLAVIDEIGTLCVYEIREVENKKIVSTKTLHVDRPKPAPYSEYHRVIWCPYIPDDVDDSSATDSSTQDNASRVLVMTNNEKAEIWSVDMVTRDFGAGPHLPENINSGMINIESHSKPIMDAAFSPDGTALATASTDGEVKFFQVYMNEETSPRCLHQWKPHGGKPMSCLFFLDNHKNVSPDAQFWKFAVTGANNNQEIKIWSCESWVCLQTVRFICPPGQPSNFSIDPCMKAALDLSARFFVLSDIQRNVLYVLQIHQDNLQNTAHVSSVSEFTLAQPCLSFAILDAGLKKFKKTKGDDSHLDEITTGEIDKDDKEDDDKRPAESTSGLGIQIKLYTVHPKALQELLIRFKPESSVPHPAPPSVSSISYSEGGMLDGLSDVSVCVDNTGDNDNENSFTQADSAGQPVLLTPDVFTSSPRKPYTEDSMTDGVRGSMSSTSSFTQVSAMNDDFLSPRSSSGSTITQTPTTPKGDLPSPAQVATEVTPSSVPLPAVTNNEETELASANSSLRETQTGETTPTPKPVESVDDFFQQSAPIRKELQTKKCNISVPLHPVTTNEETELGSANSSLRETQTGDTTPTPKPVESVDDFFQQAAPIRKELQQVSLDSTESTGLFEVTADARVHQKSQCSYDENDEEVAEVMGDEGDTYSDVPSQGTQPFDEREGDGSQAGGSAESSLRAWPKPPDVGTDAEIINQEQNTQEEDQTEDQNDDDDDDDDDVVVEEEEIEGGEEEEGEEETKDEDEEEILEEIEEEQEEENEVSEESIDQKREPMAAPVAGAGYSASPRDSRAVEVREIHKETVREVFDQKELQKLHESIGSIARAMELQQQQLDQLRREIADQQENYLELQRRHLEQEQLRTVSNDTHPSIEEHLGKLENIVTSRVERLFAQHAQKENRHQDLIRQSESMQQQKQDRLYNTVSQHLTTLVTHNLDKLIKHNVVPSLVKVLEPVKEQMHQEMAQKLTATDSLLKDNIGKMVRSRQTVETLGMAAGNAIQQPIQAAYREAFQNVVIPSFERTTQNMYQQVSDTFNRGTKEYTRQLESQLESIRQRHQEGRDPVVNELRKLTDSFNQSAEQMKSHVLATVQTQLGVEIQKSMARMQDMITRSVRDAVRDEVSSAMKEHGQTISDNVMSVMRSSAATPLPGTRTPDPQVERTHIMNLLRQGQINAAFQQALSAANLDLVMMLCEAVNPSQVFNQTPCPLEQPVLLSLIQQLSADLENNTELKHRYLEEALMNLDPSDSIAQEHLKGVLYTLNQKLKLYINAHSTDKMARALKMVLMASESLIK